MLRPVIYFNLTSADKRWWIDCTDTSVMPQNVTLKRNVTTFDAKCNNFCAKCNNFLNAKGDNFLMQKETILLTRNVTSKMLQPTNCFCNHQTIYKAHVQVSQLFRGCNILRWKYCFIWLKKLLHFALKSCYILCQKLLHFGLRLHFSSKVVTFCVNITFCVNCYILRRNTHPWPIQKSLKIAC